MANIYDVAAAIQQPNVMGNFNQGMQTAQQNQVFGQKQAAYQNALSDQQNIRSLAPQIIAGDPAATEQAQAIDPAQAAQYEDASTQHIKRLQGAMQYIDSQKDQQAKEAAYQQVRPYLAQFGQQAPATFAEAEPKMEAARAQIAALGGQQKSDLINVGAGGAIFDPKTRKMIYQNPGVQKTPGIVSVNLPDNTTQQYLQNPDGSLSPLRMGQQGATQPAQAPQGQFQTSITPASPANTGAAAQANALLAQGMQPQEVMQRLVQTNPDQRFQLAVDPATGQFKDVSDGSAQLPQSNVAQAPDQLGRSAPKASAQDTFSKNKEFADQLRASGAITTPDEYDEVLRNGKIGSNFQGSSDVTPLGDASKSGAEYLATLPKGSSDIVNGLLNGTVALPTGSTLKNPFWQSALASVKHADPTWNQAAFKQYADTRKYMTVGKGGALINNINTGAQHLQKLVDDINALDNSGWTDYNALANNLSGRFGGQAVTNFMGDVTPVASELASIYKNGGTPTDQETQHWREALSPNMSRGQQLNVVRGWIDLLAGKLNATHNQYRASMSPLSEPLNVINPKAEQALKKITQLGNSLSTTGQHETPAMDQSPVNAPGQQLPVAAASGNPQPAQPPQATPRAVNSMGHAVMWNGYAWVPE